MAIVGGTISIQWSAPRAEAAGLRALKPRLADQSKSSSWGLRYRQALVRFDVSFESGRNPQT